ncbi:hypothetical protein DFJ74DRAFT_737263 [Hyaloraphidium curvatum]|nr:hypothetical protein DFJ74DRAFT_737263 [Hyaloraphidium curvatum]
MFAPWASADAGGVAFALLSSLAFALGSLGVSAWPASRAAELVFLRSLATTALLLLCSPRSADGRILPKGSLGILILRAAASAVALVCVVAAVGAIGPTRAAVVAQSRVVITVLAGAMWLGEGIGVVDLIAAVLCVAGVGLGSLSHHGPDVGHGNLVGILAGLASACASAALSINTRHLARRPIRGLSASHLLLANTAGPGILLFPVVAWELLTPRIGPPGLWGLDLPLLAAIASLTAAGQFASIRASQMLPAGRAALCSASQVCFAMLLDLALGKPVGVWELAGAGLVLSSVVCAAGHGSEQDAMTGRGEIRLEDGRGKKDAADRPSDGERRCRSSLRAFGLPGLLLVAAVICMMHAQKTGQATDEDLAEMPFPPPEPDPALPIVERLVQRNHPEPESQIPDDPPTTPFAFQQFTTRVVALSASVASHPDATLVELTGDVRDLLPLAPLSSPHELPARSIDIPLAPKITSLSGAPVTYMLPGPAGAQPRGAVLLVQACHRYASFADFFLLPQQRRLVAHLLSLGFAVFSPGYVRMGRTLGDSCVDMFDYPWNPDLVRMKAAAEEMLDLMEAQFGKGVPLFAYSISGVGTFLAALARIVRFDAVAIAASPWDPSDGQAAATPVLLHAFARDYLLRPEAALEIAAKQGPRRVLLDRRVFTSPDGKALWSLLPEAFGSERDAEGLVEALCAQGHCGRYTEAATGGINRTADRDELVERIPAYGAALQSTRNATAPPGREPRRVVDMELGMYQPGYFENVTDFHEVFEAPRLEMYRKAMPLDALTYAVRSEREKREGRAGARGRKLFRRLLGAAEDEGGPYYACPWREDEFDAADAGCDVLRHEVPEAFYAALLEDPDFGPLVRRKARLYHNLALRLAVQALGYYHSSFADFGIKEEVGAWFWRHLGSG